MKCSRRRAGWFAFLGLLAVPLIGGCGPSHQDVIKRHGPVAQQKLDNLEAIVAQVRGLPWLERDTLQCPEKVSFADKVGAAAPRNAQVLDVAHYEKRPQKADDFYAVSYDRWYAWPEMGLRGEGPVLKTIRARELDKAFADLAKVRYVLVVRHKELVKPTVYHASEGGAHFQKGTITAEAHLFELDTKKHLGGFTFVSTNSALTIKFTKDDWDTFLINDLLGRPRWDAPRELRERAPQVVLD
jgi:hypothetical protein